MHLNEILDIEQIGSCYLSLDDIINLCSLQQNKSIKKMK
jgi:hypothetical protein